MSTGNRPGADQPQELTMTATDLTSTTTDAGSVTLGRTVYAVTRQLTTWTENGQEHSSETVHLTGPRGGAFFLRGFLYRRGAVDTGIQQVISWKSGAPLRVAGNEIRVVLIGDQLEELR